MDVEGTAGEQRTGNVQSGYENDLRDLRQELGCTPERLKSHKSLLQGLQSRLDQRQEASTIEACIAELQALVESLSDRQRKIPLLVALGFDESHRGRLLKNRRESYRATIPENVQPDIRTLQRWEDRAIHIVAQLLSEKPIYSIGPGVVSSKQQATLATIYATSTCHFYNGIVAQRDFTRWVKALAPAEKSLVVTQSMYLTEGGPDIINVEASFGCRMYSSHRAAGGTVITTFETHKHLSPKDGLYSLGHRSIMHGTRTTDPLNWYEATEPHTKRFEARVVFHEGLIPLRAWWFIEPTVSYGQIEPDASEGRHLEIFDEGRYIYKVFEPVQTYFAHGLAWIWDDESVEEIDQQERKNPDKASGRRAEA